MVAAAAVVAVLLAVAAVVMMVVVVVGVPLCVAVCCRMQPLAAFQSSAVAGDRRSPHASADITRSC